jgi:hypothetical protein
MDIFYRLEQFNDIRDKIIKKETLDKVKIMITNICIEINK